MNANEMTLEQIEVRLTEIESEVETRSGEELLALQNEAIELVARKRELVDIEQRTKIAAELSNNSSVATIREKSEETKMEERTFAVDTVEYRDAYLKSLMGKKLEVEERDALTSAANVIPTQTMNKIYGKLEENQLIGEINALHIPGYVSVPKATLVNDASWKTIADPATDSADTIGTVPLTAKKLIKTIEITADIQAMAISAFQDWLVDKLVEKMEAAICAAVINGAGTTEPTGITKTCTASAAISTVNVANLAKFMGGVKTAYHGDAVWIMSAATFFEKIVPLANDSNGMVVMNGLEYRLLGHKVILDANAKAKVGAETTEKEHIIFGSLNKGYVFNYGEGINITSDQSVAFRSGSTVYRAMALCDGAVVDEEAFAFAQI